MGDFFVGKGDQRGEVLGRLEGRGGKRRGEEREI